MNLNETEVFLSSLRAQRVTTSIELDSITEALDDKAHSGLVGDIYRSRAGILKSVLGKLNERIQREAIRVAHLRSLEDNS